MTVKMIKQFKWTKYYFTLLLTMGFMESFDTSVHNSQNSLMHTLLHHTLAPLIFAQTVTITERLHLLIFSKRKEKNTSSLWSPKHPAVFAEDTTGIKISRHLFAIEINNTGFKSTVPMAMLGRKKHNTCIHKKWYWHRLCGNRRIWDLGQFLCGRLYCYLFPDVYNQIFTQVNNN